MINSIFSQILSHSFCLACVVAGGIAVAGGDYISIFNMIITLGPGQLFVDIPVDIVNDEIFEMLESFYGNLVLTEAFDRVTVDPAMARADIMDDGSIVTTLYCLLPLLNNIQSTRLSCNVSISLKLAFFACPYAYYLSIN